MTKANNKYKLYDVEKKEFNKYLSLKLWLHFHDVSGVFVLLPPAVYL